MNNLTFLLGASMILAGATDVAAKESDSIQQLLNDGNTCLSTSNKFHLMKSVSPPPSGLPPTHI